MKLKQYNVKTKEFIEIEKSLVAQMKDKFDELSKKNRKANFATKRDIEL